MLEPTTTTHEGDEWSGTAAPDLGQALDLLRLVWAVDHALQRASRRMETTIGVTGSQRLVVRIVGRFPGISAGRLATLLHVHPGTLTGILKRLERKDLVQRRSDPRDGRRALLGLTRKGRALDVRAEGTVEAALERVIDSVAAAKLHATREVLEALASAVEKVAVEGAPRRRRAR